MVNVLVSVIIPVYNEQQYVEEVIRRVHGLKFSLPVSLEIIVVDDGSIDGTATILRRLERQDVVKVRYQGQNGGKGTAIREGLKYATGEIVLIQDADLEYAVEDYEAMLRPIVRGAASAVYGSRFQGRIEGMRWINRLFNHVLCWAVWLLFGRRITDEATAYKVIRTDLLRAMSLESRRFEICTEITAKLMRMNIDIHEVPIHYVARNLKQGKKIRWTDGVSALWHLVKYRVVQGWVPNRDVLKKWSGGGRSPEKNF